MIKKTICLVLSFALSGCFWQPPYDAAAVQTYFDKDTPITSHIYATENRVQMHYVSAGDPSNPLIVFIPGSPGTWEAFGEYLADKELRQKAFMIAVDRPGLGKSDLGQWEGSLQKQVEAILPAIQSYKGKGAVMVVGYSFGGPVATRLAVDYPDVVDSLLLLAASLDPDLEKTKFIQHVGNFPLIKPFVPPVLNVANQEIRALKAELQKMQPDLGNIEIPVTVLQGTKDKLVPAENAEYIRQYYTGTKPEIIYIEGQNHFIVWNEYERIKGEILKWLDKN